MRSLVAACLLLALPLAAPSQKPGEPSPCPPPDKPAGPLAARLVANKRMYVLDRQGMTAEKYQKAIAAGEINPPAVDLSLELTNTTKETLRLRVTGVVPKLTLTLKGKKGAVSRIPATTPGRQKVTYVTLKPGEKYSLAITTLEGSGSRRTQWFWTEPGEYTLEAQWETRLQKMDAPGVRPGGARRLAHETAKAEPITLTVKLK